MLTLQANSPYVDAGDGSGAYLDGCFPPSEGTTVNDIGAYGGPGACAWQGLPLTPFDAEIRQYYGVTITPDAPGVYRLEYAPSVAETNVWTQITNVTLETSPWVLIDPDSPGSGRIYRAVRLE